VGVCEWVDERRRRGGVCVTLNFCTNSCVLYVIQKHLLEILCAVPNGGGGGDDGGEIQILIKVVNGMHLCLILTSSAGGPKKHRKNFFSHACEYVELTKFDLTHAH
jgi:hypothetical protein